VLDIAPSFFRKWEKYPPIGIVVAFESPVDPHNII
jgi:hypothetical protein